MFDSIGIERDDKGIYHIDGVPQAYMEIEGENGHLVRVVYVSVAYYGENSEETELAFRNALEVIKVNLMLIAKDRDTNAIIFWRQRPGRSEDGVWRCRLATSPVLMPSFWANFDTKEGEWPRRVG